MPLRAAIWAAVSTARQAEIDKTSLQDQVRFGMQVIKANGWTFTEKYVVPGESRTAFISLSHAEEKIAELHKMLEDASKNRFDVLFIYDLNRFRNLMLQVFETLTDYNIQFYNYDAPQPIYPPSEYTSERKNANRLNIKLHDIISGQETNTLKKQYRDKMPERITVRKLHAGLGLPPYAYRKPPNLYFDRNAVLEIVPEEKRTLLKIKNWFLTDGLSVTEIAKRLNAEHVPSPRGKNWWASIVRYVLANPFYAGIVHFGSTKRQLDKRNRTVTRSKSTPVTAVGLHKPIWDEHTHQRILQELERRAKAQPGQSTRILTRLLHCQCGAVMWAQITPEGKYWRCSTLKKGHTYINDNKALALFFPQLVHDLTHIKDKPVQADENKAPQYEATIKDLTLKKKRWMDAYEDGALDRTDLNKRIAEINTRLDRTSRLLADLQAAATRQRTSQQILKTLAQTVHTLPHYLQTSPPQRANATLHTFIDAVHLTKDHQMSIEFK